MENTVCASWTLTINAARSKQPRRHAGGGVETDGWGKVLTTPAPSSPATPAQQGRVWLDAIQVGPTFEGAL